MNKKLKLSLLLCSLALSNAAFSESAYDSRYGFTSIGLKKLNFDKDSSLESPSFSDQRLLFVDVTYGYHLTKYLSAEASIMVGTEEIVADTIEDNFRTTENVTAIYDEINNGATFEDVSSLADSSVQTTSFENKLEARFILSAGLEFVFPLAKNFEVFASGGFNMVKMDYSFTSNQSDFTFSDNQPILDPNLFLSGSPTGCELTGLELICGNPIQSTEIDLDESGVYYGVGIKFNYNDNTSIVLGYRESSLDTMEYSGYEMEYEYRF
jgi:opacity protein-like surface antigen